MHTSDHMAYFAPSAPLLRSPFQYLLDMPRSAASDLDGSHVIGLDNNSLCMMAGRTLRILDDKSMHLETKQFAFR